MPDQRTRLWRRPSWGLTVAVVVVALVGAGIGLWATRASAATGYRLGTVSTATVAKTLDLSGTAAAVHQATADFQVAGTVSAVDVSVGQKVTAGEAIASLATTTLENDVSSAQSTLSSAQAKLAEDEAGESTSSTTSSTSAASTSSDGASTATTTTTTTTATTATTASTSGSGTTALAQAQQAVVTAQQTADTDTATASSDLANAQTACATSGGTTTTTTSSSTTTSTTTPTTSTTTTTSGATGGTTTSSTACSTLLAEALAAQKQVTTDQKVVASAETALAKLLTTSSGSASSSTSLSSGSTTSKTATSTPGSGATTATTSSTSASTGASSAGTSSTTSASDSAEQLASDQAAIDSAQASLIEAQQDLADAQLTSPISGTVVSVDLAVGQSVTAGSTSDAVTILNAGSYQVTATLTSTEASKVKVGDPAQVTVAGVDGAISGTVARVGPVDTTSSSYTYPVVVALSAGSHGIASGSSAQMTVTLDVAKDVRVVPTSAVHTTTDGDYVETLATGEEARRPVTVGVVGSEYTQITTALPKGTEVVLANLAEPVPSSSTDSTSTSVFGSTGTNGGGSTGGGFTGGAGFAGGGRP